MLDPRQDQEQQRQQRQRQKPPARPTTTSHGALQARAAEAKPKTAAPPAAQQVRSGLSCAAALLLRLGARVACVQQARD